MSLKTYFKNKNIILNPQQEQVADELFNRIGNQKKIGLFTQKLKQKNNSVYLWGKVGRGKTMLMDGFFELVHQKNKRVLRIHYHQFFKDLYKNLKGAKKQEKELVQIALKLANDYQVICFDEFHLHDITNTVLMTPLIKALLKKKVQVILTSNYQPQDLLPEPTMHKHAIPLIEMILEKFTVLNLMGQTDYRFNLSHNQKVKNSFIHPNNSDSIARLKEMVNLEKKSLACGEIKFTMGSKVKAELMNEDSVWFLYQEICGGNFSHLDYLEIAEKWKKVVLLNITEKQLNHPSTLRRFVWLIDIFYDKKIELFISSENDIFKMLKTIDDFTDLDRTVSRLTQMQLVSFYQS